MEEEQEINKQIEYYEKLWTLRDDKEKLEKEIKKFHPEYSEKKIADEVDFIQNFEQYKQEFMESIVILQENISKMMSEYKFNENNYKGYTPTLIGLPALIGQKPELPESEWNFEDVEMINTTPTKIVNITINIFPHKGDNQEKNNE